MDGSECEPFLADSNSHPMTPQLQEGPCLLLPNKRCLQTACFFQLYSQHVAFFEAEKKVWLEDTNGRREALFARKLSDDNLDLVDLLNGMIMRKEERVERL